MVDLGLAYSCSYLSDEMIRSMNCTHSSDHDTYLKRQLIFRSAPQAPMFAILLLTRRLVVNAKQDDGRMLTQKRSDFLFGLDIMQCFYTASQIQGQAFKFSLFLQISFELLNFLPRLSDCTPLCRRAMRANKV